jgi:lipid-binding SYLF domain-containing protein
MTTRFLLFLFLLMSWVTTAFAADRAELDGRITALGAKFEMLQSKSDRAIPPETLGKARGIILLERPKAGFPPAQQGGGGVALVRSHKSAEWSPVAFLGAKEASLGLHLGGQQSFLVILLMTTNATRLLTEPAFEMAGQARGALASTSTSASAAAREPTGSLAPEIIIYDDHKGLLEGAAIKAGAVSADNQANHVYYGQTISMTDILFGQKVKSSPAGAALARTLQRSAKLAVN